ncbi:hypothetical protein NERG_02503 [Nematocida ausubeli]|uniref:Uncharacterized protein n=1 Tax=Nematocida ausubeli (strain ATCC PRA-371 / ERTm2) TaxID=1913371 RepID=H8ZFY2_NEMA1|nr:hypothetical protein NERG_02503 [Nematocida ausubeli]
MLPSIKIVGLVSLVLGASLIAGVYLHNANTSKKKAEAPRIATIRNYRNNAYKNKSTEEFISLNRPDSTVYMPNMVKCEDSYSKMYPNSSDSDDRRNNMDINQKKNNVCHGANEICIENVHLSKYATNTRTQNPQSKEPNYNSKDREEKIYCPASGGIQDKQEVLAGNGKKSLFSNGLEAIPTESSTYSLYAKSEVQPQPNLSGPNTLKNTVQPQPNLSRPNTLKNTVQPQPNLSRPNTLKNTVQPQPNLSRPNTLKNTVLPQHNLSMPEIIGKARVSAQKLLQNQEQSNSSTSSTTSTPSESSASNASSTTSTPSESSASDLLPKCTTVSIYVEKGIGTQHMPTKAENTTKTTDVLILQQEVKPNISTPNNPPIEEEESSLTANIIKLGSDLRADGLIPDPSENNDDLKEENVEDPPQLNVTNPIPTDKRNPFGVQPEIFSNPGDEHSPPTDVIFPVDELEMLSNLEEEHSTDTNVNSSHSQLDTVSGQEEEHSTDTNVNSSHSQPGTVSGQEEEHSTDTNVNSSHSQLEILSNREEGQLPETNEENSDSTSVKANAKKANISVSDILTIQKVFTDKSGAKWNHLLHAVDSPNKDSLNISINKFNKSMQDPIMHMLRYNQSYIEIVKEGDAYPKTIDMKNLTNTLGEYIKKIENQNHNSDVLRNMKSIVFHTILLNSLLETSSKSILKEGDIIFNLRKELDNEIENTDKEHKQNKNIRQPSNAQELKKEKIKAVLNKAQDQLQPWKEESKTHAEEIEKSVSDFMEAHKDLGNINDFNLSEIANTHQDNHPPAAVTLHNKTSPKEFFLCNIKNLLVPKDKQSENRRREVKTTITFDEMSTRSKEKTSVIYYLLKNADEKRRKLSKNIGSIFFEECSGFISNCNASSHGGSTLDLRTNRSLSGSKRHSASVPALNSISKTLPGGELYILSPNKILTFSASVLANIECLLSKIEKNTEGKETWCDSHTELIALVRFTMCIFANASLEQCNLLVCNRVNSNIFSIVYKLLFYKNTVSSDIVANYEKTINKQKHSIEKNSYFEHNGLNNRNINLWGASALDLENVDYIKNILKHNNRK